MRSTKVSVLEAASQTRACLHIVHGMPILFLLFGTVNLVGNAKARELYGTAQPPLGISPEDAIVWRQFLVDKYVHRKFAEPLSWPPNDHRDDLNRSQESPRRHSRCKKGRRERIEPCRRPIPVTSADSTTEASAYTKKSS